VRVRAQRSEEHQFLFEAPGGTAVEQLTRMLARLHNARLRLEGLAREGAQLAQRGPVAEAQEDEPVRPASTNNRQLSLERARSTLTCSPARALTAQGVASQLRSLRLGDAACQGARATSAGAPPAAVAVAALRLACDDARQAVHKARHAQPVAHVLGTTDPSSFLQRQVDAKVPLTLRLIEEHTQSIVAALAACYPSGLSPSEPVARCLCGIAQASASGDVVGEGASAVEGPEEVPEGGAALWGPGGKALCAGKLLSDTVGRNEKTRVTLRLCTHAEGAPGRSAPTVSAEEQAAMLSFYRKKQEEEARVSAVRLAHTALWLDHPAVSRRSPAPARVCARRRMRRRATMRRGQTPGPSRLTSRGWGRCDWAAEAPQDSIKASIDS